MSTSHGFGHISRSVSFARSSSCSGKRKADRACAAASSCPDAAASLRAEAARARQIASVQTSPPFAVLFEQIATSLDHLAPVLPEPSCMTPATCAAIDALLFTLSINTEEICPPGCPIFDVEIISVHIASEFAGILGRIYMLLGLEGLPSGPDACCHELSAELPRLVASVSALADGQPSPFVRGAIRTLARELETLRCILEQADRTPQGVCDALSIVVSQVQLLLDAFPSFPPADLEFILPHATEHLTYPILGLYEQLMLLGQRSGCGC